MADARHKSHDCPFEFCGKSFSRPSRLAQHICIHTAERPYKCPSEGCDRSYTRPAHLKRHLESSHVEESEEEPTAQISCNHEGCHQVFKTTDSLKKHENRCHNKQRLQCTAEGCGRSFSKKTQLKIHIAAHEGVDPFKCDFEGCNKGYSLASRLARHKKVHDGYACKEEGCDEKFPLWTLLRKHMAIDHIKTFACEECGKSFATKRWLKQHAPTHKGTRDMYMCPEADCERGYLEMRNLNSHLKRDHEGQNQFKCDHDNCGKNFSTKQKLQLHIPLHDPNRPVPVRIAHNKRSWASRISALPDNVGKAMEVVQIPDSNLVTVKVPGADNLDTGQAGHTSDSSDEEIDTEIEVVFEWEEEEDTAKLSDEVKIPDSNVVTLDVSCDDALEAGPTAPTTEPSGEAVVDTEGEGEEDMDIDVGVEPVFCDVSVEPIQFSDSEDVSAEDTASETEPETVDTEEHLEHLQNKDTRASGVPAEQSGLCITSVDASSPVSNNHMRTQI